ncbi:hypothetical protein ABFS83_13G159900 [Erythranthe nasuta]
MEDAHSSYSQYQHHSPPSSNNADAHVADAVGSINGAKYRLMSPAKLPISRSTSITIPPGLSPTSFLDSPVLLSNIKAEPSPTTGSFFKPHLMQGSGENAALSLEKFFSGRKAVDEKTSSSFEFRFQTGASSTSGLSSAGLSGSVVYQDQHNSQPPVPSQPVVVGAHNSPIRNSIDELNQGGQSNTGNRASSSEHKDSISTVSNERTSEDGYNWRKYGQKLVKGSEFPRSYYKCTYPNCEVKKIFERSPSGQITEIVYKGSHDHPKPQPARRQNSGALLSIQEDKPDKDLLFNGQEDKLNNNKVEQNGSPMLSPLQANEDNVDVSGSQYLGLNDDVEEDDPFLKRRKMEEGIDATPVVKPIREPRVVVQTLSEVDILDDGYRWRKYGQKVVRGNPNPRSYYKCTNVGCPVRKHVERASHDPKAVITTYEGKHNHDVPTAKNNNNSNNNNNNNNNNISSHDFSAQYAGANSKLRPPQDSNSGNGSISLDLGVGIGREAMDAEEGRGQIGNPASAAAQIPAYYGIVNMYGNRDNRVEGRNSFQAPPMHPSNQCPPSLGRILMGP